MERELDVYFAHSLVGKLVQNEHGRLIFTYAEQWLANKAPFPLSQTLPLQAEPFTKECHAFFGGLLPEESKRETVARILGVSARNDFAMLERIGGECAGAITFLPAGEKTVAHENKYREITESELASILHDLPKRPLMAGENGIRLSLAGAQDKLAVVLTKKILLPLDSSPSTHIIKPDHPRVPGLVYNEAFCLKLAQEVGIPTAAGELRKADGTEYLAIARYDRITDEKGNIQRLHQEDFCQALGIPSEIKYQSEGGPSLKQCFDLVRRASSVPILDIRTLLDAVIFNFLIGNNDAHGKNFSFLYRKTIQGMETRLAPLYDLICIAAYPEFSDHMAMSIAKKYRAEDVYTHHWEQFALDVGLAAPMVKKRVVEMAGKVIELVEQSTDSKVGNVTAVIMARCQQTIARL